ncbi:YtoQ family protein [Vibrio europaeus]|uniref:YtoQ family protein n=1 Tax=Vibrio europaeus TaxID=300876 RepID=A0A178J9E9_9VIBR|nr:YtoQ family protein [Vibrio europaeus]MDC5705021.1 YtoQ family protein [Vibrio europaeus]MDC5710300.1 YtoQ family protein [Vibrio europaeus]MDC5715390.1 YtoQ family protein [Vibrio europaeus]MDC5719551.1 YtoQ family protein [Vibrio europaeus]MDC5724561.1 YtoQ family protein [Vibrio europaeus]
MIWKVYLSGEIHTDWRERIIEGVRKLELNIEFYSANTDHKSSDAAGDLLRQNESGFWRDHQSSKVNAIRTSTLIKQCDIGVVRFGEKYRQWNAAFDAGMLSALDKPYITLHDESLIHPLKEVDAAAMAWAESPEQVVELLKYVVRSN